MPPRYYNVKEAAKTIGISEVEVKQLLERRELHGYRDGADWKFKVEDIERIAKDRTAQTTPTEDEGDVLLSEVALGHSDPSASGTVIGMEPARKSMAESDIRLADSDVHLADSDIGLAADSDIGLASSDIKLAAEPAKPASGGKDAVDSKVSQFEELDLTLDQDLTLEDSNINSTPSKPGESAVDLSGKKLDDDDLVLGGSGTGSDIAIGGDSGISLVDPADSGLSLEEPLNLGTGGGDESLELGEDDMLSFTADTESSPSLKTDDDFQLTPMPDADADDSESGSQVIALDTEGEGDEGATMIATGSGGPMAAMLDEDLSAEGPLGFGGTMPLPAGGDLELPGQPSLISAAPVMQIAALPEAPYSILNVISLILCTLLLVLVGIMMFDLLEHMRHLDTPHFVNSSILDWFLGWFEK